MSGLIFSDDGCANASQDFPDCISKRRREKKEVLKRARAEYYWKYLRLD
jgi:hypothetical protein